MDQVELLLYLLKLIDGSGRVMVLSCLAGVMILPCVAPGRAFFFHTLIRFSSHILRNPEGNKSANIAPDSGSVLVRQSTVHIEIFTVGCRAESESEDKQDCGFIFFLVPKGLGNNKLSQNAPDVGPYSRRAKRCILKYSPLAAVRKASRKTSRIVDLFHSWFLKALIIISATAVCAYLSFSAKTVIKAEIIRPSLLAPRNSGFFLFRQKTQYVVFFC
jgi:hypothetical protein